MQSSHLCPLYIAVTEGLPLASAGGQLMMTGSFHLAGHSDEEIDRDMALAYMGLKPTTSGGKLADSADPTWLDRESPPTLPISSSDNGAAPKAEVRGPLRF